MCGSSAGATLSSTRALHGGGQLGIPPAPRLLRSGLRIYSKPGEKGGIEIKAGYLSNNTEFIGLQVGGASATAAQGVYAVLPYQVGMSYFPLASPAFNIRVAGPRFTYWKSGVQRSLDEGVGWRRLRGTGAAFVSPRRATARF